MRYCQESSKCRIVLLGPGGFNVDADLDCLPAEDAYKAVNDMTIDIGRELNVAVINATEIMAAHDGTVYQPTTNVWSEDGHQIMAREIGSVIASEVRATRALEIA